MKAALACYNHSIVEPYADRILAKIGGDGSFGHAVVFSLRATASISGLRLCPLGVVTFTSKNGVICCLTFSRFSSGPGATSDTDFAMPPPCNPGHALR